MAFVNENITKEDFANYEIEAINRRYVSGISFRDWTIDRSRNIYIRLVGRGREEFAHESEWTLYFEEHLIEFGIANISTVELQNRALQGHKKLRYLNLPESLSLRREEIIAVIHEALVAYQTIGVFCKAQEFALTLDI